MPGIAAGHAPTVFAARTSAAASPTGRTGQGPGRPGEIATRCAGNRDGQGPDRPGAGQATRKRWPYYRRCLSWGL